MEYTIKNRTEEEEVKNVGQYSIGGPEYRYIEYTDIKFCSIVNVVDIDKAIKVLKGIKETFKTD